MFVADKKPIDRCGNASRLLSPSAVCSKNVIKLWSNSDRLTLTQLATAHFLLPHAGATRSVCDRKSISGRTKVEYLLVERTSARLRFITSPFFEIRVSRARLGQR